MLYFHKKILLTTIFFIYFSFSCSCFIKGIQTQNRFFFQKNKQNATIVAVDSSFSLGTQQDTLELRVKDMCLLIPLGLPSAPGPNKKPLQYYKVISLQLIKINEKKKKKKKRHVPSSHYLVLPVLLIFQVKWKSLSRVQHFVTLWTIQSMEFSRPQYWSR